MKTKALAILLFCLILSLCVLDAPEYVRCDDVGICEFHEILASLDHYLERNIIINFAFVDKNIFFTLLENQIESKEFFQYFSTFFISGILRDFEISFDPKDNTISDFVNPETKRLITDNCINLQTLKLLSTSVILS